MDGTSRLIHIDESHQPIYNRVCNEISNPKTVTAGASVLSYFFLVIVPVMMDNHPTRRPLWREPRVLSVPHYYCTGYNSQSQTELPQLKIKIISS